MADSSEFSLPPDARQGEAGQSLASSSSVGQTPSAVTVASATATTQTSAAAAPSRGHHQPPTSHSAPHPAHHYPHHPSHFTAGAPHHQNRRTPWGSPHGVATTGSSQTDAYRSIEEVERDFAFLEGSSSQDAIGSSPLSANNTSSSTTTTSSPSLPMMAIVNPSMRETHAGSGWSSDGADWSSGRGSAMLPSLGESGPATFPIKQESAERSPLLPHHYYGGGQSHSHSGEERLHHSAEASTLHHQLLRHQMQVGRPSTQLPNMGHFQLRRPPATAPFSSPISHSSGALYSPAPNSSWDSVSHDGSVTTVASYPAYAAPMSSSSFSGYPSSTSVPAAQLPTFSSLPSFSAGDLPTSLAERRGSEPGRLGFSGSGETMLVKSEEQRREASAEKEAEGGDWNEDDDSDDDEEQDEEGDKEGQSSRKRLKKSQDSTGAAGQAAGIRSRKRSNAGDVAAAKKKKVALERERRKELTNFFYRLQSCVPSLRSAPTRPTKAILLQSACDHIHALESELAQLRAENQRLKGRETAFSSGGDGGPSGPSPYARRPGPGQDATRLLFVLCCFFVLLYTPYGVPFLDFGSSASAAAPGRVLGGGGNDALGADHALHQQQQQPTSAAAGAPFGPFSSLVNLVNLVFFSLSLLSSTGVILLGWLVCLGLRLAILCCVLLFLFLLEPVLPAWNRKIFRAILMEMNSIEGMYQIGTAEAGKQLHQFLQAFLAWGKAVSLDKATCDRVVLYTMLATRLAGRVLYRLWIGLWIPARIVVRNHCNPLPPACSPEEEAYPHPDDDYAQAMNAA